MLSEKKVHPIMPSAGNEEKAPSADRQRRIARRMTSEIVTAISVGIDIDLISIFILMQMILLDVLWSFACVGPDPRQGWWAFVTVWALLYWPVNLIVLFDVSHLLHPCLANLYLLPVTIVYTILALVIIEYMQRKEVYGLYGSLMTALNWITHLAVWLYSMYMKFKLSVRIKYCIILLTFLCLTFPILMHATFYHQLWVPIIISLMETSVIVCAFGSAVKNEKRNDIYMVLVFQIWSASFETFRFLAFLDILNMFFLDWKKGFLTLVIAISLNICFQAYSQTDLCFYVGELLQDKTGTNGNRSLPRVAFSTLLGILQNIFPSGVSIVQDLVGESKELEKAIRLYYTFVWSMTFRIPTLFTMYILLNKMYRLKHSSSYENLVSRWGYVMLIYMLQEILAETLCRVVDFVLSVKWRDYHARYSYPKVMLQHYQRQGLYVCAAFQLAGATMAYQGLKLFK